MVKFLGFLKLLFISFAGLLLAGCSLSDMAAKILPDEVERQMGQVIEAVTERDIDAIKAMGSEEFKALDNLEEGFKQVFEQIVSGDAVETKLVNAQVKSQKSLVEDGITIYSAQYERIYEDGTNLYTIVMVKQGEDECCALHAVNLKTFKTSPSASVEFSFKGKGMKHFAVLGLAITVPVFIIFMLIKCVRTKDLQRKWLWFIFILVGLYGVVFNWNTGDLSMSLLSRPEGGGVTINFIDFKILGASIEKTGAYAPWILEVGFPLGAVIFWFKARKIRRQTADIFDGTDAAK